MSKTIREVYIEILQELVKEESPPLYLEDFLYYYNKAVSEYMKVRYELFEVNQQLSDDMRAWKKSYDTTSLEINIDDIGIDEDPGFFYRHLVNCIITVDITRPDVRCDQEAFTSKQYKVTRMSSEIKAGILNNAYLSAEIFRPYYEIINNKIKVSVGDINIKSVKISNILVEYLKQPVKVDMTEDQVTDDDDATAEMECSDDVTDEITKVALKLILERGLNPRLQTNVAVNQAVSDMSTGFKGGK